MFRRARLDSLCMSNQRFTGTGKTLLVQEIARSLARPPYEWHIKSTSKAQQGLYEYHAESRLRDSQRGDARVHDIGSYIVLAAEDTLRRCALRASSWVNGCFR
jgi:MoxR-like ATPase